MIVASRRSGIMRTMRAGATYRIRLAVAVAWAVACLALFGAAVWLNGGDGPLHARAAAWLVFAAFAGSSAFSSILLCAPAARAWAFGGGPLPRRDRGGLLSTALFTGAAAAGVLVDLFRGPWSS